MKESETSAPLQAPPAADGFQISDQPMVTMNGGPAQGDELAEQTKSAEHDLLYLIARDPKSLFLYWEVDWTRLFAKAGITPGQVQTRIYRQDGSVEATRTINPFLDHAYLEVSGAGAGYRCELGCLQGDDWTSLVGSGSATTPEDRMSDDFSSQFATLPMHLSFQRMLASVRRLEGEPAGLAEQVGQLQEEARSFRQTVSAADWDRMIDAASTPEHGQNGGSASDLRTLLESAARGEKTNPPSAAQLAAWRRWGEQLGGSSGGGTSASAWGGSSSA